MKEQSAFWTRVTFFFLIMCLISGTANLIGKFKWVLGIGLMIISLGIIIHIGTKIG